MVVAPTRNTDFYDDESYSSAASWVPVHDRRVFDQLVAFPKEREATKYYCLRSVGRLKYELYEAPDMLGCRPIEYLGQRGYVEKIAGKVADNECMAEKMAGLIGFGTSPDHSHGHFCSTPKMFLFDWRKLER